MRDRCRFCRSRRRLFTPPWTPCKPICRRCWRAYIVGRDEGSQDLFTKIRATLAETVGGAA